MKLIKYDSNWADEIDIDGFIVLSDELHDNFIEAINRIEYLEFYIGTNEEIIYESPEEILNDLEISDITVEQAKVLYDIGVAQQGFAYDLYNRVMDKVYGEDIDE